MTNFKLELPEMEDQDYLSVITPLAEFVRIDFALLLLCLTV